MGSSAATLSTLNAALGDVDRILFGIGSMHVDDDASVDVEKAKKNEVIVRGFASMNGVDRDGDNIDPLLFDIDAYMKNPIVYWNHEPWQRKEGNKVSIGITESMNAVSVKNNETNAAMFDLFDLHTGALVETIDSEEFMVKSDDKGLWVRVRVLENDVVKMVREGRAKAFSWKGALRKTHDTRELKIDMYEVSLVTVPAQNRSLFAIAKAADMTTAALTGLLVQVSPDGRDVWTVWDTQTLLNDADAQRFAIAIASPGNAELMFLPFATVRTVEEARALAVSLVFGKDDAPVDRIVVMLKPTGKRTMGGADVYETEVVDVVTATQPTQKELSLLRLLEAEIAKNAGEPPAEITATSDAATTEGGELDMADITKILESLNGLTKSVDDMVAKQADQDKRIDELVQQKAAKTEDAQTEGEPAQAVAKSEDAPKSDDGAANANDEVLEKIANSLTALTKSLEQVSKRQDDADARIAALAKTPQASRQITDEEEISKSASEENADLISRYQALDSDGRRRVNRTVLGTRLVPNMRPVSNGR